MDAANLSAPTVDLSERLAFLQRQLHAINQAWAQAKARGDTEEQLATLRRLFVKVSADIEALKGDALKAEAPSAFMQTLAAFSDEATKVGATLGNAAVNTIAGVGALVKYLPIILVVAVVVVGLVVAGKIRKELK